MDEYSRFGMTAESSKNYSALSDYLSKISYKPGWKIALVEDPSFSGFIVRLTFEDYESRNAAFEPIVPEVGQVADARRRINVAIGKTYRQPEMRYFQRGFDYMTLDHMRPEDIIRYVIGDTIKQAEMMEFDRWFKFEGVPVFEHKEDGIWHR